MMMKKKRKVFQ